MVQPDTTEDNGRAAIGVADEKHRRHKKHSDRTKDVAAADEGEKDRKESRRRKRDGREEVDEISESGSGTDDDSKHRKRRKEEKKQRRKERREEKEKRKLLKEAKRFLKEHGSEGQKQPGSSGGKPHTSLAIGHEGVGIRSSSKAPSRPEGVQPITEADYFSKNPEYSTWLLEERGVFFSALSSEETHAQFGAFVAAWNEGQLAAKYYRGIKATDAPRSGHNWVIAGQKRYSLRDTAGDKDVAEKDRRAWEKAERRKARREQEELVEELLPRATGREARVEQRKVRREEAKAREESPEMVRERDVLGGSDDFHARLAREKAWRERRLSHRVSAVQEKQKAYSEREDVQMEQLRALVSMAGGKITIPKRE